MNSAFREFHSDFTVRPAPLANFRQRFQPGSNKEELMSGFILALADLAMLGAAWLVGAALVGFVTGASIADQAPLLLVLPLLALISAVQGLYPGYGLGSAERIRRRWSASASFFALLGLLCAALPVAGIGGALVGITGLVYAAAIPLVETIIRLILKRRNLWGQKVILNGDAEAVAAYTKALNAAPDLGLVPAPAGTIGAKPLATTTLPKADDIGLQGLFPVPTRNQMAQPARAIKRALDLAIGLIAGLCALPLIAIFGAMIYAIDKGPIFYAQPRLGLNGRIVKTWKLRSMYQDSQARLDRHLAENAEAAAEWKQFFKLKRDPRILPKVGPFIRTFSIDELPQIWNIICGELSVVGPRIFPEYHMKAFSPEFQQLRLSVQPGLTGLWQTSVRSEGDLVQQETLDRTYIRNWSLWLDIDMIYRTFGAVLGAKGAV